MAKTKIEWAQAVWNPVTGCTKVSQGCKNCYAETIANRFWGERKFTDVQLHPEKLEDPLRWKKPRRVFVNSMSDLFHEDVPKSFIAQVFAVMAIARQHTFLILTKRPERMLKLMYMAIEEDIEAWQEQICNEHDWCSQDFDWPLPNVRLGVSVEDQAAADNRIPLLLQTPAAVRFVSVEPMLGAVEFGAWLGNRHNTELGIQPYVDWVICGGESGTKARPMHPDWARSLRDQCQVAGVPFFFKQWGEWAPADDQSLAWQFDRKENANQIAWWTVSDSTNKKNVGRNDPVAYDYEGDAILLERKGKTKAGRLLDGAVWDEYPE